MKRGTLTVRHRIAKVLGLLLLAATTLLLATGLYSQNSQRQARAERLSYVDGTVRLSQGNNILADQAVVNTPLFEGTQIAVEESGKAEVQFEDGSVARIAPNSALTLKLLQQKAVGTETEIMLDKGLAYFELQGTNEAIPFRIRFNDCVVTASGTTVLRINLDKSPGEVAVFSGSAHLQQTSELALDLQSGESVTLSRNDPAEYNLSESIEPDSWDSWNTDREQALTAESSSGTSTQSSSTNNSLAWGDLNINGVWYNVPGEGNVWSPYVASDAGWDPYGEGNWMWSPAFGYYWVSAYPWGYLPYQCGMWNYYDTFGWGWLPGMGGCSTWWSIGVGYYGGPNIGYYPDGYRKPKVPQRSIIERPGDGRGPHPILSVNRNSIANGTRTLPLRNRNTPVVIAGHTVQALKLLAPRQQYNRSTTNIYDGNRIQLTNPGAAGRTNPGGGNDANTYRRSTIPAPGSVGGIPRVPSSGNPASGNTPRAPSYRSPAVGSTPRPSAPSGTSAGHLSSGTRSSSGNARSGGGGSSHSSNSNGSHSSSSSSHANSGTHR
jgi:hypothetical protein